MSIAFPRVITAAIAAACLSVAAPARAQGALLWGEYGVQNNSFGDETQMNRQVWGFGMQFVIGGDSSQSSGFLVPVGFELRSDTKLQGMDMLGYGDLAFRVKNFSFGPGANFGYLVRPPVEDFRCPLFGFVSGASSCYGTDGDNVGKRDIGQFYGFGFSGFGKLNFGPQGRAQVQVRYILYHPDWIIFRSAAEALNVDLGTDFDVPLDYPEFEKGHDLRLSLAYVFGSAGRTPIVVRGQYTHRDFTFSDELANVSGIFDQDARQFAFGVGFAF